jgi:ribonuclease VapC
VVVDTSALLAILFNERHGAWAADQLQSAAEALLMSTVNYAELLILVADRQPALAGEIQELIEGSSIRLVAPGAEQAAIAAKARLRYPLNLGDCFAYALATAEECRLLTLDRDFRKTDLDVVLP